MNSYSRRKGWGVAVVALATALLTGCQTSGPREREVAAQASHDGLVPAASRSMDQLYLKPGVTFAGYERLRVDLTEVAFRADWQPERSSPLYRMSPPDRERIKERMASSFKEVFTTELTRGGSYTVVEEAGEDVLGVRASLLDLYINAPDTLNYPGRVTQYTEDTGSMTLVLELYDSITGEVLARAVDRDRGYDRGWLQRTDSVWNQAEAERTFRRWAAALRQGLEEARRASAPAAR